MPMVLATPTATALIRRYVITKILLFSVSAVLQSSSYRSAIVGSIAFSVVTPRSRHLHPFPVVASSPSKRRPSLPFPSSPRVPRRLSSSLTAAAVRGGDISNTNSRGIGGSNLSASAADDEARTGWIHNTESHESGEGASSVGSNSEEGDEARTGWLHNTEPRKNYQATDPPNTANEHSPATIELMTFVERINECRNHRIAGPPAVHPCGDDKKRMMVTEHRIAVPLDHPDLEAAAASPSDSIAALDRVDGAFREDINSFEGRPTVDVYFTVVELLSNAADEGYAASLGDSTLSPRQRAEKYLRREGGIDASRMILYLQGGPGFGCATPISGLSLASSKSSWASSALFGDVTNSDGKSFERVVLMDQRGTGRSMPVSKQRLRKMFPDMFLSDDVSRAELAVKRAADYLTKFRADSIVRDAEWIKEAMISGAGGDGDAFPPDPKPWGAALGQSFGGFCLMTYLSSFIHPPQMCLFTGGLAPMDTPAREVYDRLWLRVRERNYMYYERYPGDVALVRRIVQRLMRQDTGDELPVRLPSGGILTVRRFLQLGLMLGGTPGTAFANLHSIISSAFLDDGDDELSEAFLKRMDYEQSFDDAPLYFLLHESIYADGPKSGATNWAAHSSVTQAGNAPLDLLYERYVSPNPDFEYRLTSSSESLSPVLFYGEMVFPWMAEGDFAELSGDGMRKVAEALARKEDWLPLFDASNMRAALLGGGGVGKDGAAPPRCRVASATYYDDMYVDFNCAMKLVRRGGPMEGAKVWVTNEYQHSGLRDDGAVIFCKLVNMAKGSVHVPS